MKKLIVSFLFALGLVSCSNEVPEPDTPEVVSNTSRLLSLDGPVVCYDFEYDDMGRVLSAELHDYLGSHYVEYKYDKDHIYISYRRNDDPNHGTVLKEDTLFLVDGRVDSCAGKFLTDYRIRNKMEAERFYVKIRYNERGEMIYCWEEDVWPYYLSPSSSPKIQIYYCGTTYEWKDGNIVKIASVDNMKYVRPTSRSYSYSSLPGNNVLMEARYVRPEYYALVENGYFGVACKNLMESFEDDDGFGLKYDYELDSQKRVVTIKEIRTYEGYDYFRVEAYNLKWSNAVNGQ